MPIHLRLDQDEIDEQDDKVVLDVFVGKFLAVGALREADAFAEGAVVGFGVGGVEGADGGAA